MGIITLHFRLPYIVEILIERTKAGGGENSGRPSECLGGGRGEKEWPGLEEWQFVWIEVDKFFKYVKACIT